MEPRKFWNTGTRWHVTFWSWRVLRELVLFAVAFLYRLKEWCFFCFLPCEGLCGPWYNVPIPSKPLNQLHPKGSQKRLKLLSMTWTCRWEKHKYLYLTQSATMCVLLMGFWGWWCYFNAFSRSFSAIARHMPFNKTYAGMLMPQVFRIFRIQYKCCMWCRKWNDCKTGAESMQLHYRSPMFPYCNIVQKHFVQSNCRFMFLTPLKQQVILSIHLIVWTSVVGTTPPKINMSPDFRDHFKVQGQFIFQPEIFRGGYLEMLHFWMMGRPMLQKLWHWIDNE